MGGRGGSPAGAYRHTTAALALAATAALAAGLPATAQDPEPPTCTPGGEPVVLTGEAGPDDEHTYVEVPVEVAEGTTRVEVGYSWENRLPDPPSDSFDNSVVDLGLWDADGYRSPDGFRGWSGSREGRIHQDEPPVWVQADTAERGYLPGPIEAGTWWVDLGIAAVHSTGLRWRVEVRCLDTPTGPAFEAAPVDPDLVVADGAGWYHGDFHMHGVHSNSSAPPWDDADPADVDSFVEYARDAGLQFAPVTDYVTTQHWRELGPVQDANPDLLLWPGREVITYSGHVIVLGETSDPEYRHGLEDVTLADIIARARADGALISVAHPTHFEPPLDNLCRGCAFALRDEIDWSQVDTIEVLTGPKRIVDALPELAGTADPEAVQPFIATATDYWEALLLEGHRITAVSGSDDKLGPFLGSSATAVHADALSRDALTDALRAGHAFVKLDGAEASPHVEVAVVTPAGTTGMMGDAFTATEASATVTVTGGAGQVLRVSRDGEPTEDIAIDADPFTHELTLTTADGSGPLGTFWRVDTVDATTDAPTTIGNPVYVGAPEAEAIDGAAGDAPEPGAGPADGAASPADGASGADEPEDGGGSGVAVGVGVGVAVAVLAAIGVGRRRRQPDSR